MNRILTYVVLAQFVVAAGYYFFSASESDMASPTLDYSIIEETDLSYEDKGDMVYRVQVKTDAMPSEAELKYLTNYLWQHDGSQWDTLTIFLYLPEMNTDGMAYAVADFNSEKMTSFRVQPQSLEGTKWQ